MVAERLRQTINEHDLDAFVECFSPDYRSEQPVHPGRAFQGRDQVRKNWSIFFRAVPDLTAEILASVKAGDIEWTEWHWHGTREDATPFEMCGVIILGLQDEQIAWSRLYMEEVEPTAEGIDSAVQNLARPDAGARK